MSKIGFTIGKFAPLHKGHQYLIETALKEMDELYVLVYETNLIDISLNERAKWIENLYPNVNVILAKNPPNQYGLDEKSVKIQTDYLKGLVKDVPVTHFYSSEKYGEYVARDLNVENRIVDFKRLTYPIRATDIRKNIRGNKNFLDKRIYNEVANKISG